MNKSNNHLNVQSPQAATDTRYQSTGVRIRAALEELQWQMAMTDEITEQRPSDDSFVGKRAMQGSIQNIIEPHRQSAEGSQEAGISTLRDHLPAMLLTCRIEEVSAIRVVFENGDTVLVRSQDDPVLDRSDPIQKVTLIQSAQAGALLASLQNIGIRICPKERHHPKPHVHIDYGRIRHVASFWIEDGERIIGDKKALPYKYDHDIKGWLSKHRELVLKIWHEYKAGRDPAPFIAELKGNA